MWSLGVILYMLVTGHAPFQEANDSETLTMILDCKYYLPPSLSSECQDLIKQMLVRDPEKRILLESIAKHNWLSMNHDHGDGDANEYDFDEDNDLYGEEPLMKLNILSPTENDRIIQNMVNGNIATRDEIKKWFIAFYDIKPVFFPILKFFKVIGRRQL